jgi:Icc-related predicted phosphoesterase
MLDSFGKPILMLHGNHEDHLSLKKMCSITKNIKFSHNEAIEMHGMMIITHGGGGFNTRSRDFEDNFSRFEKLVKSKIKSLVIFHAPPANTKLDELEKNFHVGNTSYRKFIDRAQPTIVICGHIHETFGK